MPSEVRGNLLILQSRGDEAHLCGGVKFKIKNPKLGLHLCVVTINF